MLEAVVEGREYACVQYKYVKRDLYTPKETYKRDERTAFVHVLTFSHMSDVVLLVKRFQSRADFRAHCNTSQCVAVCCSVLQCVTFEHTFVVP